MDNVQEVYFHNTSSLQIFRSTQVSLLHLKGKHIFKPIYNNLSGYLSSGKCRHCIADDCTRHSLFIRLQTRFHFFVGGDSNGSGQKKHCVGLQQKRSCDSFGDGHSGYWFWNSRPHPHTQPHHSRCAKTTQIQPITRYSSLRKRCVIFGRSRVHCSARRTGNIEF
jgi:hypothetical protein